MIQKNLIVKISEVLWTETVSESVSEFLGHCCELADMEGEHESVVVRYLLDHVYNVGLVRDSPDFLLMISNLTSLLTLHADLCYHAKWMEQHMARTKFNPFCPHCGEENIYTEEVVLIEKNKVSTDGYNMSGQTRNEKFACHSCYRKIQCSAVKNVFIKRNINAKINTPEENHSCPSKVP